MEALLTARLETLTPNVYPSVAPKVYQTPCVVYQVIDTETFNDLDGFADQSFVTIQLSVSATTYGAAKRLSQAIRDSLRDWNDVQAVSWIGEHAGVDNSTDTTLHRILMFFRFFVSE